MDFLVLCVTTIYLYLSPYSKVEESFNLQACHDLLYHGINLSQYDHLEFPGVVPRTFIGPIITSIFSSPFVLVIQILQLPKLYSQYIVRLVLSIYVYLCWRRFFLQVKNVFGSSLAAWFLCITITQFHFLYYASRTLPNIYALGLTLLACSYWLEQKHKHFIWCSGAAITIFRAELSVFFGIMLIFDLVRKKYLIKRTILCAVPAGITLILVTVTVDSIFWKRILWPEGEVFWYNTYLNQSANWGVYPFLYYWYSVLPRALGMSYPLVFLGLFDLRVRIVVAPALLFILLYSILPHKELRFIIYSFPLLNVAAARCCQFIWNSRAKSRLRQIITAGCASHLLGNIVLSLLLASLSIQNYPGGEAMALLHRIVPAHEPLHVHIDNFAAQTGVSRFTELNWDWRYNKTENLKPGGPVIRSFTHLLIEAKSKYAYNLKHYTSSHVVIGFVEAFSHLSFNYNSLPPFKIRIKPAIYILKNLNKNDIDWSQVPGYLALEVPGVFEDTISERELPNEVRGKPNNDLPNEVDVKPNNDLPTEISGKPNDLQKEVSSKHNNDPEDEFIPSEIVNIETPAVLNKPNGQNVNNETDDKNVKEYETDSNNNENVKENESLSINQPSNKENGNVKVEKLQENTIIVNRNQNENNRAEKEKSEEITDVNKNNKLEENIKDVNKINKLEEKVKENVKDVNKKDIDNNNIKANIKGENLEKLTNTEPVKTEDHEKLKHTETIKTEDLEKLKHTEPIKAENLEKLKHTETIKTEDVKVKNKNQKHRQDDANTRKSIKKNSVNKNNVNKEHMKSTSDNKSRN